LRFFGGLKPVFQQAAARDSGGDGQPLLGDESLARPAPPDSLGFPPHPMSALCALT
jgi:hypothetical protein